MRVNFCLNLSGSLVAALLFAGLANGANIKDIGASERVNYSGKLRMLSQRIAAAACNYGGGIDSAGSKDILTNATIEFDKIINALEFGDPDLKIIGSEKRRKTLAAIEALSSQWKPVKEATETLIVQGPSDNAETIVTSNSIPLLERAKLLVSELSGQYSDPTAILLADAMLVDISGRQRMLTQKMSKEACLIWEKGSDPELQKALSGTMQTFEISLRALRDGLASAGIKPAPTPGIESGLDDIWSDWLEVKPLLALAVDGEGLGGKERAAVYTRLNVALKKMNDVVGLYTAFAKTGL